MTVHASARCLIPLLMLVVVLLLSAMCALAHPPVALAQAAPSGDTSGSGGGPTCLLGPLCGIGDLGTWLQQTITRIVTDLLNGVLQDFVDAIVGFINDVNFLTHTPENLSYNNDLVRQFQTAVQVLADSLLGVATLVSGYNVMLRPYMGISSSGAREVLPRLVLGAILINTAAWWCKLAIDVNNAMCGAFGAPTIADSVSTMLRVILDPTHLSGPLMLVVVVVMAVLLLIQQLMRLALVDVLVILAPLAALVWILPQSQAWGRLWMRLFVGTVFAQAIQVLTLRLGFNLATGLPPLSAAGLLQPLLGIAVLALALKVPSVMGGGAAGGNIVTNLMGTAAGAVVGAGAGIGARAALGVGTRAISIGAAGSRNGHSASPSAPTGTFIRA
jgi:hypothetical protein